METRISIALTEETVSKLANYAKQHPDHLSLESFCAEALNYFIYEMEKNYKLMLEDTLPESCF